MFRSIKDIWLMDVAFNFNTSHHIDAKWQKLTREFRWNIKYTDPRARYIGTTSSVCYSPWTLPTLTGRLAASATAGAIAATSTYCNARWHFRFEQKLNSPDEWYNEILAFRLSPCVFDQRFDFEACCCDIVSDAVVKPMGFPLFFCFFVRCYYLLQLSVCV